MTKHINDPDWDKLLDELLNSSTNLVSDIVDATKDIYATWIKGDAITNTPLHRKERSNSNGKQDIIK